MDKFTYNELYQCNHQRLQRHFAFEKIQDLHVPQTVLLLGLFKNRYEDNRPLASFFAMRLPEDGHNVLVKKNP
ncbi:hypothetical protein P5G51_014230 [Virgibacillus sp. 179-BFC.A HS]|uniref:Uncharacterized protein n=1 Tax=Tigheibacillus jepli TaxID=3035914 RepID=A0ABU5CKP8_9BACI|nr:hypothetical protein [Virgibacillus sp. 179-BFC.A HS]MDY0406394.1 hypothetical protein [Virgibacillus sp. 179-BFC.A HS]